MGNEYSQDKTYSPSPHANSILPSNDGDPELDAADEGDKALHDGCIALDRHNQTIRNKNSVIHDLREKVRFLESVSRKGACTSDHECGQCAHCLFNRGRYEEAAIEFEDVLKMQRLAFDKIDGRISESAMMLAICYHRVGRHRQARHFCEQVINVEEAAQRNGYKTPGLHRARVVLKKIEAAIKKQARAETQVQKLRKQHEVELTDMRRYLSRVEAMVDNKQSVIVSLRSQAEFERDNAASTLLVQQHHLEASVTALRKQLDTLREEQKVYETMLHSKQAVIDELRQQQLRLEEPAAKSGTQLWEKQLGLEESAVRLRHQLDTLKEEHRAHGSLLHSKQNAINSLRQEYSAKVDENESLIASLAAKQSTIASLSAQKHSLLATQQEIQMSADKMKMEHRELQAKYHALQSKYAQSNHQLWTSRDIAQWISGLNPGYSKYREALSVNLTAEGIDGLCLKNLDKTDLHRLGITQFKDKCDVYRSIQQLINKSRGAAQKEGHGQDTDYL